MQIKHLAFEISNLKNGKEMMKQIFYFGCMGQAGHYLFGPEGMGRVYPGKEFSTCFGEDGRKLDTPFCPPMDWPAGKFVVMTKTIWTIVSWWDYSVDSRPGSHSTFIFTGYDSLEEFWKEAKEQFPSVFNRQPAPEAGESEKIGVRSSKLEELCAKWSLEELALRTNSDKWDEKGRWIAKVDTFATCRRELQVAAGLVIADH